MIELFSLIATDPDCIALLGSDPLRFTPFGLAEQGSERPYCVHQILAGTPYNQLGGLPPADHFSVQIDAYADRAIAAEQAATAVLTALERDSRCTVTDWGMQHYEPDTRLYRVGFDVDFIQTRRHYHE